MDYGFCASQDLILAQNAAPQFFVVFDSFNLNENLRIKL